MPAERHFTPEQVRRAASKGLKGDAKALARIRTWLRDYPAEVETASKRSDLLRDALRVIEHADAKH